MRILLAGLLLTFWSLAGCSQQSEPRSPTPTYSLPAVPPRPTFEANVSEDHAKSAHLVAGSASEVYSVSSTGGGSVVRGAMRAVQTLGGMSGAMGTTTGNAAPTSTPIALPSTDPAKTEEKIEREAQFALEVKDVTEAATRVVALARAHEGTITKDQRTSGSRSTAEILVRVPSAHFDAFNSELGAVGEIRNRNIRAVDVGIEHKDLTILVANLEAALTRYRDLLQRATEPMQVLAVERELERVRSDLDRVKGRLAYVTDRVARSTVAIALHSSEPPPDVAPPSSTKPYIAPGLRGFSFVDVREGGTNSYFGTGLTIRLPHASGDHGRGTVLDVDVMKACCKSHPDRSAWAYNVLLGVDLYSEALKSGRRRWLNPYLGFRAGFSQTQNRGDFAAAGVFGLEIFKTSSLMIDLQVRAMALVGNPDGPHAAIQPSLGFDVGF